MGQKTHPTGFRLGIVEDWRSRWYADKRTFGNYLVQDQKIRAFLKGQYAFAGVAKIEIERTKDMLRVIMHSARPGLLIGRKGAELEKMKKDLEQVVGRQPLDISVREVDQPETEAQLVCEAIVEQLLKRAPYRRVLRKMVDTAKQAGCLGIKITLAGRLGGVEIARNEKVVDGSVPLHTLRAKIDYGFAFAKTAYGTIGVKCWIYKGMVSEEDAHGPNAQKGQAPQVAAG